MSESAGEVKMVPGLGRGETPPSGGSDCPSTSPELSPVPIGTILTRESRSSLLLVLAVLERRATAPGWIVGAGL